MKNINKQNLSKDIQRQKIMFGISLFAVIYFYKDYRFFNKNLQKS